MPYYTTQEMADNPGLEGIANVIESTLYRVWTNDPYNVNDRTAARLVELMIDRYHFNDEAPQTDSPALEEVFCLFSQNTGKAFSQLHSVEVVKILAAVYRSIQRRTVGGTSYLQFVSQFTGINPDA